MKFYRSKEWCLRMAALESDTDVYALGGEFEVQPGNNVTASDHHEDQGGVFKINQETFHVEILNYFLVMTKEEILKFKEYLHKPERNEQEKLLARVIQEVIDGPVPSEQDLIDIDNEN